MKRVLITGVGSYIGQSFETYIKNHHANDAVTDTIDMIDARWRDRSFEGYDVVFHVAGIAHADVGNVTEETKALYYSVNTDLAIEVAEKAKHDNVGQFIYMSSMIVYGGEEHITADTQPSPSNFYGDSKWQADKAVREIESTEFKVVVLRPPMIYGKGSKGNYPLLAELAKKSPLFPKVPNKRSMLYVENLCEFVYLMIKNEERGIFFPQNKTYVNTAELVEQIAKVSNHKIYVAKSLVPFVTIGQKMPGKIGALCQKAFGDSYYDMDMSIYKEEYCVCDLKESVKRTEG